MNKMYEAPEVELITLAAEETVTTGEGGAEGNPDLESGWDW